MTKRAIDNVLDLVDVNPHVNADPDVNVDPHVNADPPQHYRMKGSIAAKARSLLMHKGKLNKKVERLKKNIISPHVQDS